MHKATSWEPWRCLHRFRVQARRLRLRREKATLSQLCVQIQEQRNATTSTGWDREAQWKACR
eukprot:CAMPEP_0183826360 /NCGR_PEP_ID=MMETSP0807_2-20130328/1660_1 /TAXON_ID=88271 /ORGANISM="Picocystis salinarum, Strain CCMP1897" /LENGTH=61 /DNA_ID=CAMNT_0026071469 /DNA_START=18 /DNA_END=203 /DNA_ORIENTATION=+